MLTANLVDELAVGVGGIPCRLSFSPILISLMSIAFGLFSVDV